jgi:mannitol/fructose-specific phosphotransferase system IIA component (Ntr-type)
MENLADSTKEKVIEALAAQILSSSAVRSAEADWQQALEEVEAITSRTVRPENLLAEMDQAENVTITRGR